MPKFNGFTGDYTGLSFDEAAALQAQYGKNELNAEKKQTLFSKVLGIFKEPMFLLLFCTALIYFFLGEPRDGSIMIGFVLFMSCINLFQEWRTDKTLAALKDLSAPKINVIRSGEMVLLDSCELTVGDLMILEEGDKIPADGEIIEMFDLGVDESTLTGESDVVWKKLNLTEEEAKENFKKNACYSGTVVTQGSAIVGVTSIGADTEYGKIGKDILSVPNEPTPLEKQTRKLIKSAAIIGILLFIVVGVITFINPTEVVTDALDRLVHSVLAGVTLAMAMIPEEFPVILTVFLAMGAWRLAKKNALIRRMPSVETLGAVTVLCVDKTGTLTQNKMTMQEISCYDGIAEDELIEWSCLGCEIEPYDPMEKAIIEFTEKRGFSKKEIFDKPLIHEYSFNNEIKMMGHIWEIDGSNCLAAKGSPESILPLCGLEKEKLWLVEKEQERLSEKGYRVIAVAKRHNISAIPDKLNENKMEFLGLIGLEDPPRENVPEAVKLCSKAGIRVVMITGDNGITARSIAKKIGIQNADNVITGSELEKMTDEELSEKVKFTNIFARVIPSHKMRIVKAFRDSGEVVAMTGDGVNDAPALKYADIGIAMGKRGTGVAKEAADMVLLDDNFTTIVENVKDGRRIYDNIKKAVGYVFTIHLPIALIALLTPLLRLPLLLLPVHIVLLELIIDPTCSIIFERQPAEKDIMERKPRLQSDTLASTKLLIKAVLQGLSIFAASFGSYAFLLNAGWDAKAARSFALVILVISNFLLVYVNHSEKSFAFSGIFKRRDKVMWIVNSAMLLALMVAIYLPYGNVAAKTVPLGAVPMLCAVGIAAVSTMWWEIVKLFKRN